MNTVRDKKARTERVLMQIPPVFVEPLGNMMREFGYITYQLAGRNCIAIALKLKEQNPQLFLKLLREPN